MSVEQYPALRLLVGLGIGLLIGAERERRKGAGPTRSAAGVRTFALTALAGGISYLVGQGLLVAVAAATVGIFAAVSYRHVATSDPGLTSEMALFTTVLLGALAIERPAVAAGLAVVVTVLLAARAFLHRFLRIVLTEQELHDALLLAAASLVILPLVPNHSIGPYGVLNPRRFGELVVLVMAVSAAGYIALRAVGSRLGLPIAGIAGGFVSAAATIGSMASRAARDRRIARGCAAGAVLSSISTVALMALVLLATNRDTARAVAVPLLLAGIAAAGYAAFFIVGRHGVEEASAAKSPGHAFSLKEAFLFAATLLSVLFVCAAVTERAGVKGLFLATGLAGFGDAHSAAISAAALVNSGKITATDTAIPILTGLTTNSVTKAVLAAVFGGRRFFFQVAVGLGLMVLAAWVGFALL